MSSRVEAALDRARAEGRGALVAYLPAGYPTVDASIEAVKAVIANGADVIELGIPYSDPVMDGPVIQRATVTALENGFRVAQVFDIVRAVSQGTDVPILVMTYWNPVVQYGIDRFAADFAAAGGAGLITPDLIPDEASEWIRAADAHDLDRIFLAAPSSSPERMKQAVDSSRGFVYAVSTMGITGQRGDVDAAARSVVASLRTAGAEHVCVGIGISTPDQVTDVVSYAEGAIVGSHLVAAVESGGAHAVGQATALLVRGLGRA
ncbi:tryptophan synthase alpha chain [Microbacteriaceae bacterium MWH-Ta3]|nr:tryptophan synthase alpha chain [Microbacteriaceae bacterium MWH-Ta3]